MLSWKASGVPGARGGSRVRGQTRERKTRTLGPSSLRPCRGPEGRELPAARRHSRVGAPTPGPGPPSPPLSVPLSTTFGLLWPTGTLRGAGEVGVASPGPEIRGSGCWGGQPPQTTRRGTGSVQNASKERGRRCLLHGTSSRQPQPQLRASDAGPCPPGRRVWSRTASRPPGLTRRGIRRPWPLTPKQSSKEDSVVHSPLLGGWVRRPRPPGSRQPGGTGSQVLRGQIFRSCCAPELRCEVPAPWPPPLPSTSRPHHRQPQRPSTTSSPGCPSPSPPPPSALPPPPLQTTHHLRPQQCHHHSNKGVTTFRSRQSRVLAATPPRSHA